MGEDAVIYVTFVELYAYLAYVSNMSLQQLSLS